MNDPDKLIKDCETVIAAATEALAWVGDERNADTILLQKPALERSLRRTAYEATKLKNTADRPMCVGVFGPSQCGKSYLISYLAGKNATLTAVFNDSERPNVNFVEEINPQGGKESTGLVTRFTFGPITTPEGFPVALRMLTQTDLIKIFANMYWNDARLEYEEQIESAEIEAVIVGMEKQAGQSPIDILREEDIWDLQEYFTKYLKRYDWTRRLEPFWDRIARLAPRLEHRQRTTLYSIFWGCHEPITDLYLRLLTALGSLGYPEEAYCKLDALIPSQTSVINVDTLKGLFQANGEQIRVTAKGRIVELPRAVVTAIAAELRISAKEQPHDFYGYTDLLDFPGYRSRLQVDLRDGLKPSEVGTTLWDMFTRGKVDYLFQRYTADQELTSMLLCLKHSNMDVTTLPSVIDEWAKLSHGETPEQRQNHPILLFFVLTFFDNFFEEKASDKIQDKRERFQARMAASMLKPFGSSPSSWPMQWTPGHTFKNCYWIRNPNVKSPGVIEYDGFREVGLVPSKEPEIKELREAYASVKEVQEHFEDPLRAWDEAMRLNDGGVSYLTEKLAKVCLPSIKPDQVASRLATIRSQAFGGLDRFYTDTADLETRLKRSMTQCREVLIELDRGPRTRSRFGSLLRALCVDRVTLSNALFEARTTVQDNNDDAGRPGGVGADSILRVFGIGDADQAPLPVVSRFMKLGVAAVTTWTTGMRKVAEDEPFASAIGLKANTIGTIVLEIEGAAKRCNLAHELATRMEQIIHIEKTHEIVAKAAIVCERTINQFVSTLGYGGIAVDRRPLVPSKGASPRHVFQAGTPTFDGSGIGKQSTQFAFQYIVDWCLALQQTFKDNAASESGSVRDIEQNSRLGSILAQLR